MNPLFKIVSNTLRTINRLINGLKPDVVRNIKQGFYFLVFILTIVVIVIGYNMGREAARIKSPPLAERVKDVFEIDVSREKGEKETLSMQSSKFFLEEQKSRRVELPYKISDDLKPEGDRGIIDNLEERRRPKRPAMKEQLDIIESEYRPVLKKKKEVDILHENKKEKVPVLKKEQNAVKKKSSIRVIEETGKTKKEPQPIKRDWGPIE